jgi:hypothetical protein
MFGIVFDKERAMGKIEIGKAFEEYVTKRCEEIIEEDAEHQEINEEIISLECKLSKLIPEEATIILNDISNLKDRQVVTDYCKIYISGFNDRIKKF